jgi:hypothetical protein
MIVMASELGADLLNAIMSKDAPKSLTIVTKYKESMKDPIVGAEFVRWISEPVNLTSVHRALANDLGIPPRLLAIKKMPMTRVQRSVLLVHAMELAIKRTHSL